MPNLSETWSTSAGPRLQIQRNAAAIAPGTLSATAEMKARQAVTTGPPQRSVLSAATLRPFGTLADLPHAPRALFSKLTAPVNGFGPTSLSNPVAVGHAMNDLVDILDFSAPTPSFLKALYRMLAIIPGVSDAGWTTDRAGRPGIGIAVPTGGPGSRYSTTLIADPHPGQLLDVEDIQINPNGDRVPVPSVVEYDLYLRTAAGPTLGARPALAQTEPASLTP